MLTSLALTGNTFPSVTHSDNNTFPYSDNILSFVHSAGDIGENSAYYEGGPLLYRRSSLGLFCLSLVSTATTAKPTENLFGWITLGAE